jgi:hypothetical protein
VNDATWSETVEAVRAVALGKGPSPRGVAAANGLDFLVGLELTPTGRKLVEDGILRGRDEVQRQLFAEALRRVPPVRELIEGAWGQDLGRDQAADILRYVYPPARRWGVADFTRLFETLNYAGLVKFNRKTGILRSLVGTPSARLDPAGGLVSRDTPYRNRRLMADLVRSATGRLWWFDSHFTRQALQFIYDEADFSNLTELRILSCGRSETSGAALDEYRRFHAELGKRGVMVEWRTLLDREDFTDKHDRWVMAGDKLWNVPPFTAVMQDKFGSLLPDPNAVPLSDWWAAGTQVTSVS